MLLLAVFQVSLYHANVWKQYVIITTNTLEIFLAIAKRFLGFLKRFSGVIWDFF